MSEYATTSRAMVDMTCFLGSQEVDAPAPRQRTARPSSRVVPLEARLDETDRHLLALLQANAREPAANLARRLKVARTTVVSRIARLERAGIVAGYGVRLGRAPAQAPVRAYCGLSVSGRGSGAVIKALERMPEVIEVCAVSGAVDYMVFVQCETHEQLDQLLDRLAQIDGVQQTHTNLILSRKIDRRGAPDAAA